MLTKNDIRDIDFDWNTRGKIDPEDMEPLIETARQAEQMSAVVDAVRNYADMGSNPESDISDIEDAWGSVLSALDCLDETHRLVEWYKAKR
jgi:hypothetical protein